MQIKDILDQKGYDIHFLTPDLPVSRAAEMLVQHEVGAAVVATDASSIVGMLSERDVIRAVAGHDGNVVDLKVEELMTCDVITCVVSTTIPEALEIMRANEIRHLPVLSEDDSLIGIISMRDLMAVCIGDMMGMGMEMVA